MRIRAYVPKTRVVLYDGDPLEYTSHVCMVLIEGEVVSDVCR